MNQPHDDRTSDALERLERATMQIATRAEWEQGNRRGLLWVHGIVALFVGVQILLFGGPGNIERAIGIWTRPALGAAALAGGVLLCSGLASRPRSLRRELLGLVVIAAWDLCMTAGIVAARVDGGQFAPRPLLEPQPEGYVVPYPVLVYGGLLALICIHLYTLRKLTHPRTMLWSPPPSSR